MATKRKFYVCSRYVDTTDGLTKTGYLPKEGFNVPNDLGIDLAVYKNKEKDLDCKEVPVWHVTDVVSGLEVAHGKTKKDAINAAFERLKKATNNQLDEIRYKARKQYGEMPDRRIFYL